MSLDVELRVMKPVAVFDYNITHNLNDMAEKAGIYNALWHPEELGVTKASQLIPYLVVGLERLTAQPEYFKNFNTKNGWGDYDALLNFVLKYIDACTLYPDADVWVSR